MVFNKAKYFLVFLFLLILSFLIFLSTNYELRRSIFSRALVLHDFYRIKKLTIGLQNRDFNLISERLQDYIDFSKSISKGKNYMFEGIYKATELAVSRAVEQEDYNSLQNIFKQLIEIDNRVYKHHVWYARALSDDNVDKALKHLNKAIKISLSESDAYREIIRIGQDLNDIELTSKYCKIYNNALSGGRAPGDYPALFNNYNNDKFAIKLFSKNKNKFTDYLSSTTLLNKINNYEFLLSKILPEISGLDLYFSPVESLKLEFSKIYYYDDDKVYEVDYKDLTITSQNSYIEENKKNISVFLIPQKDGIIRIKHKNFKNIKKIKILMNIKKMSLASNSLCKK